MPKLQTPMEFLVRFKKSDVNNEYELITDFKNSREKIRIKHKKCGNEYSVAPYHFLNGQRCVKCGKYSDRGITHYEFSEKYKDLYSGYELLSEYKGSHEKIKMKHLDCGSIINISPSHFKNGRRCRFCSMGNSKMEAKVEAYLSINNIEYEREHTFTDCLSERGKRLSFDFLITIDNSNFILLECDGSQHYDEMKKWYSERNLKNDSIKDQYSINKGINLIRIREDQSNEIYQILRNNIGGFLMPTVNDVDLFYKRKIKSSDASEIRKKYISGKSSFEIAQEYNTSKPTIVKIINYTDFGELDLDIKDEIFKKIKLRRKSSNSLKYYKHKEEMVSMYNQGISLRRIGKIFGCSNQAVKRIIEMSD
jgi:hypothetical protein